jgi:hypothetical protein
MTDGDVRPQVFAHTHEALDQQVVTAAAGVERVIAAVTGGGSGGGGSGGHRPLCVYVLATAKQGQARGLRLTACCMAAAGTRC